MLVNLQANKIRVPKYPGTDKYNLRTLLDSYDKNEEEALWDFVKVKHNILYQNCEDGVRLPIGKPLIPLTPIEVFQKPPALIRRRIFFKTLDRGDVLLLRVENECDDSYKLLTLAKHQGCWKIDDLSIVMYLPKYDQEMKLLKSPIEVSSIIRAAFCSCWLKERKLYVTLDNSIVKDEFKYLTLGKQLETDLPHYIGNTFLGISYTDYLFSTAEFKFSKRLHQLSSLGIDSKTRLYSHFNNLEKKKYSELECASHLKMKQNKMLSESYYHQALHCLKHKMPNITMVHLNNALQAYAKNVDALLLRGKLHSSFGNSTQAFIDTNTAVRLDHSNIPARKQMSRCLVDAAKTHIEQGNDSKAEESLNVAKDLDSSNIEAYLSIEEIRDQMNNNLDSQVHCAERANHKELPFATTHSQHKKKKSKKHHRKRSRHHHKKSKPTAQSIFLPGRKSPIPPPPAYPWDSHISEQERLPSSDSHQKSKISSKRLVSSVCTIPKISSALSSLPLKKTSSVSPSFKNKQPHILPTLSSNKSLPLSFENPLIPISSKKSQVSSQIRSLHYFDKHSPPDCAPRSLSPIQSRSPPVGLCRSITSSEDHKLISQDLDRNIKIKIERTEEFCENRLAPECHRSRSPPSHRSRSPPSHKSRSPPSHRSRSPPSHRRSPPSHRSRSPRSYLRSRSPQSYRSRSPQSRHRNRSPQSRRSRSPQSRRSRSPPSLRRSKSPPSLRRSRSPPNLRRSRSPPSLHRSRSPRLRRSRSPQSLRRSRSPPPSFHRSRSPPRSLRRSRSPPRRVRINRSPPRLRRSKSPTNQPLHQSFRSRSSQWKHRSPSADRNRSRSPSPYYRRRRSPSLYDRSRSQSPDLRKSLSPDHPRKSLSPHPHSNGSPSADLYRSRSTSPEVRKIKPLSSMHRSRSPSVELCLSRSPSPYQDRCLSKSPSRVLCRNKSPPPSHHRSRSPPQYRRKVSPSHNFHMSRLPPQSFQDDESLPHVLQRYDHPRRSPPHLSKNFQTHDFTERSTLQGLSEETTILGLSERSASYGLSERSVSHSLSGRSAGHITSDKNTPTHIRKRKELIKSILEKRSVRVASNTNIAEVATNQDQHERSPTNNHSHHIPLIISTVYSRRSPAYNMSEVSQIESISNRTPNIYSEQQIPTIPSRRRSQKSSFYRNTEF